MQLHLASESSSIGLDAFGWRESCLLTGYGHYRFHAVADGFLVNVETNVIPTLHGGASSVESEIAESQKTNRLF